MTDDEIDRLLRTPLGEEPGSTNQGLLPSDFLISGAVLPPVIADDPAEKFLEDSPAVQMTVINRDGLPVQRLEPIQFRRKTEEMLMTLFALPGDDKSILEYLKDSTNLQRVAVQLVLKARGGDMVAIKEIFDRVLGKPKQHVESISTSLTYEQFLETLESSPDEHIGYPQEDTD